MYYNNITGNEDDDLKFIPLNVSEPFRAKDSTWVPIIDIALPAFSEMPNSFALSFSTPFDNSNVQPNTLKTLDFIQNDNGNLQKNNQQTNNQQLKNFEQEFDLEYPSEIFSEELTSYNKDEKCKQNTSKNNMNTTNKNMMQQGQGQQNTMPQNMMQQGQGQQNTMPQNMMQQGQGQQNTMPQNMMQEGQGQQNTMPQNMMPQGQGQQNIMQQNTGNQMGNVNSQSMNKNREYLEEPIHMELLRNLDFEDYLIKSYRGEDGNQIDQIDNIFKMINNDNSVTDTFKAYNIPRPIYELITKKIIKMTLDNSNCKWGE